MLASPQCMQGSVRGLIREGRFVRFYRMIQGKGQCGRYIDDGSIGRSGRIGIEREDRAAEWCRPKALAEVGKWRGRPRRPEASTGGSNSDEGLGPGAASPEEGSLFHVDAEAPRAVAGPAPLGRIPRGASAALGHGLRHGHRGGYLDPHPERQGSSSRSSSRTTRRATPTAWMIGHRDQVDHHLGHRPERSRSSSEHGQEGRRQRRPGLLPEPDRAAQPVREARDRPGDPVDQHARLLARRHDATTSTATQPRASINIPDGVNSLRFGGADTTKFFGTDPTQSLAQDGQNDQFLIRLGVPASIGTSIVVNKVISDAQAAAASTTGTANSPTQKSVVFEVAGRINLFQANEIDGNTAIPRPPRRQLRRRDDRRLAHRPDQRDHRRDRPSSGSAATRPTSRSSDQRQDRPTSTSAARPTTSRSSWPRARPATSTSARGPTPDHPDPLDREPPANRGMTNSNIVSERMIGDLSARRRRESTRRSSRATTRASGRHQPDREQRLSQLGQYFQSAVDHPDARRPGRRQHHDVHRRQHLQLGLRGLGQPDLAAGRPRGDVTFGDPEDVFLPLGKIIAKVQGSIDNSTRVEPEMPTTAFYAHTVVKTHGVVVPPNVVEEPICRRPPRRSAAGRHPRSSRPPATRPRRPARRPPPPRRRPPARARARPPATAPRPAPAPAATVSRRPAA